MWIWKTLAESTNGVYFSAQLTCVTQSMHFTFFDYSFTYSNLHCAQIMLSVEKLNQQISPRDFLFVDGDRKQMRTIFCLFICLFMVGMHSATELQSKQPF